MAISPEVEAELRALCEAATSGPWHRRHEELRGGTYWVVDLGYEDTIDLHETENGEANTAFIDAAREWFLPLLDQIAADREMREEADRVMEPFASVADRFDPDEGDDDMDAWGFHVTIGELRNVRAARAKLRAAVPAEQEKQS